MARYAAVLNSDADTGSEASAAAKTFALLIIYKMPPPPLHPFSSLPPSLCRVPIPLPPKNRAYISSMLHIVRSHPNFPSDAAAAFLYLLSQNAFIISAHPLPIHGQWAIELGRECRITEDVTHP